MIPSWLNYVAIAALGFVAGAGAVMVSLPPKTAFIDQVRLNSSEYELINPLLYVRVKKDTDSTYTDLERAFEKRINEHINSGNANTVSVYFRDLTSGRWTGVNEDDTYTPSSLLKVALIMSVLNIAAETEGLLNERVVYDPEDSELLIQNYSPATMREAGLYRISDLVEATIKDSDNAASVALGRHFQNDFVNLYTTFQLPELPENYQKFMSPREYSTLFRALYNGTYLSGRNSEYVLYLLTLTNFNNGLVAGVPEGTTVAHKFGENTLLDQNGAITEQELHDCGIIYLKPHPYYLCVMTEGENFAALEEVIADLSSVAYAHAKNFSNP